MTKTKRKISFKVLCPNTLELLTYKLALKMKNVSNISLKVYWVKLVILQND